MKWLWGLLLLPFVYAAEMQRCLQPIIDEAHHFLNGNNIDGFISSLMAIKCYPNRIHVPIDLLFHLEQLPASMRAIAARNWLDCFENSLPARSLYFDGHRYAEVLLALHPLKQILFQPNPALQKELIQILWLNQFKLELLHEVFGLYLGYLTPEQAEQRKNDPDMANLLAEFNERASAIAIEDLSMTRGRKRRVSNGEENLNKRQRVQDDGMNVDSKREDEGTPEIPDDDIEMPEVTENSRTLNPIPEATPVRRSIPCHDLVERYSGCISNRICLRPGNFLAPLDPFDSHWPI